MFFRPIMETKIADDFCSGSPLLSLSHFSSSSAAACLSLSSLSLTFSLRFQGRWKGDQAAGSRTNSQLGHNPQYSLKIESPCTVVVILVVRQKDLVTVLCLLRAKGKLEEGGTQWTRKLGRKQLFSCKLKLCALWWLFSRR